MFTKSGTSLETDTATAAESAESTESAKSAGSAGSTAEPAEAESKSGYITARDEACSRPKWTDVSRLSGSR